LTETHQRVLLHIVLRLQSGQIQDHLEFSQVNNMISDVLNNVTVIDDNVHRIDNECCSYKMSLRVFNQEFDSLKMLAEENENRLRVTRAVQDFSLQVTESLKQRVDDRQAQTFDGTLEWKISDVRQKMGTIFKR
jgi:GTP-sensing pleiotropic transcriptional regulator CodY